MADREPARLFSSRTGWDQSPNRLSLALAERRRAGLPLLDLTESNPTCCGFAYPTEALQTALAQATTDRYEPHPRGLFMAREAIAMDYHRRGCDVDPDGMVLTAGTSEAYAFLFRLLADPGDVILVPRPSYPLFDYLAELNDVTPVSYPLHCTETGWRIDLEALHAASGPRARALIVVHPNNPTGSFVSMEERRSLLAFCRDRGLALIADEVFADYPFEESATPLRFAGAGEALTFALGGLSKSAGLPHLKLSWIAVGGPDVLAREALARLDVIADTYLTVSAPVQRAVPALLGLSDGIRASILSRVRENRNVLRALTAGGSAVRCLDADGGWYAVLSGDDRMTDDETWALDLLEREGVFVHPGHFYDFAEEGRLVISLLPPTGVFREGIRRVLQRPG